MKVKTVNRVKLLFVLLPIMAIVFYALSAMRGTNASTAFTPPEIVESISVMNETPDSGAPSDFSPIESFAFANFRMYTAPYFEGKSSGSSKANLGFTKYTQNVRAERKVCNKTVFTETVSSSAFVSNAEQTYITPKNSVLIRLSKSVHGDSVVWSDKISPMNTDTYFARYGSVPREVSKYSITEESVKSAALVSVGSGEYVYEFVLDPQKAGVYFSREVATRSGSSQPVEILSAKITVTMNENWQVLKTVVEDSYNVAVPALGMLTCASVMEESFKYYDDGRTLSESTLFEPYLPNEGEEIIDPTEGGDETEKPASTYLSEAFAPYLGGEPLELNADIDLYGSSHSLQVAVDIGSLDINAVLDEAVYVGYGGGNVYIQAGGLKGYLPLSAFKDLLQSGVIELPDIGLDFAAIKNDLAEDLLGALFKDCVITKEDSLVKINFAFKLSSILKETSALYEVADNIRADVSIVIKDGETISLEGIDGVVDVYGRTVKIGLTPVSSLVFPDRASFPALEKLLDFVAPIANTAGAQSYELNLKASVKSEKFTDNINAQITLNRDLTLGGRISFEKLGLTIDAVYDGKTVYLSSGGINVKVQAKDLKEIYAALQKSLASFGVALPDLPELSTPKPHTTPDGIAETLLSLDFKELVSHIINFEMLDDTTARAELELFGKSLGAELSHDGEYLTSLKLDETDLGPVSLGLSATLKCFGSKKPLNVDKEYVEASELVRFIDPICTLMQKKAFTFDLSAALKVGEDEISPSGKAIVLLKESGAQVELQLDLPQAGGKEAMHVVVAYAGGTVYISYGNSAGATRVSAGKADYEKLKEILSPILPAFTPRLIAFVTEKIGSAVPKTDVKSVLSMLDGISLTDENDLAVELTLGGVPISLTLKAGMSGALSLDAALSLTDENLGEISAAISVSVERTLGSAEEETLPALSLDYIEASRLTAYLDSLINTFKQEAYDVSFDNIDVYYADKTHKVSGYVRFLPTDGIPNLRAGLKVYERLKTAEELQKDIDAKVESDRFEIPEASKESYLRHSFDIMITDGEKLQEIYLTYNGVKFKLTIKELLNLLAGVKDALGISDGTILDRIIPADREKVSGEFLADFNISALKDISAILDTALKLVTDIADEAHDFMYDPDYDYTSVVGLSKKMLAAVGSMIGADNMPSISVGGVLGSLMDLPSVSLTESADESGETRTMTVNVNGTLFTLSRDIAHNRLTHWTFDNLATKKTVTDFELTLTCPDPQTIADEVARPVYHDYSYATSFGGNYKQQELLDKILRGEIEGVTLPNYDAKFVQHDASFSAGDVIPAKRYKRKWAIIRWNYSQSDSGDYVLVKSGDYIGIDDLVTKIKELEYVEFGGEYLPYSEFTAFKNELVERGETRDFDSYYADWFASTYGMTVNEYTEKYLGGSPLNDLSDISTLTTALINTANRKNFVITGNVALSLGSIININIPLDIRVKIVPVRQTGDSYQNKPLVMVGMSTPKVATLLKESHTQIYYWDGYLYMTKYQDGRYYHVRMTMDEFGKTFQSNAELKKFILFVLPLEGLAKMGLESGLKDNADNSAAKGEFKDFWEYYYFKESRHYVGVDLGSLVGTTALSSAEVYIGSAPREIDGKRMSLMREIGLTTKLIGMMDVKLEAVLETADEIFTYRVYEGGYKERDIFHENQTAVEKGENLKLFYDELDRESYDTL